MSQSHIDEFVKDPENMRLLQREVCVLTLTELVIEVMDSQGINRADLAKKLGKTPARITQLLDEDSNITIGSAADVFTALGKELRFSATDIWTEANHNKPSEEITPTEETWENIGKNSALWRDPSTHQGNYYLQAK